MRRTIYFNFLANKNKESTFFLLHKIETKDDENSVDGYKSSETNAKIFLLEPAVFNCLKMLHKRAESSQGYDAIQ